MTDQPTDPSDATDATPTTRFDPPRPDATPPRDATPQPPDATPSPDATPPPAQPLTGTATAEPPPGTPPAPPIAPSAPPPPSPPPFWRPRYGDPGRVGPIVLGVILLVIGLWFFADQTLGLDMPRLRWSQLWPILIIGLGAWIAVGSMRRP